MEQEILEKLKDQEEKIENIQKSIKWIKKYFLWMLVLKFSFVIIPLIGLVFAIPWFINVYSSTYGELLK